MTVLIFTHYGNSFYLPYTLNQASASNPNADRILIGDESNRAVAIDCGWDHISLIELRSPKRDAFNAAFHWVQGSNHNPVKGGKDWLRYVSERFFAIESFCHSQKIAKFWHFDSDTMILHNLEHYEDDILRKGLECTTLCNDSCPSGLIKAALVENFTTSMIMDYHDKDFLLAQQYEFDHVSPSYAFTEMRAFKKFRDNTASKTERLSSIFQSSSIWFDDCICQDHDFQMSWADRVGRPIKDLYWRDGEIYGLNTNEVEFRFASVNCSWVPVEVFEWIKTGSMSRQTMPLHASLSQYLKFTKKERLAHQLNKVKAGFKRFGGTLLS